MQCRPRRNCNRRLLTRYGQSSLYFSKEKKYPIIEWILTVISNDNCNRQWTCLNSIAGASRQENIIVVARNSAITLRNICGNISPRNVNTEAVAIRTYQSQAHLKYHATASCQSTAFNNNVWVEILVQNFT